MGIFGAGRKPDTKPKRNHMNTTTIKTGDKITSEATYRGQHIPAIEWEVGRENKTTFKVHGILNAGRPDWQAFSLYMSKRTGKISS